MGCFTPAMTALDIGLHSKKLTFWHYYAGYCCANIKAFSHQGLLRWLSTLGNTRIAFVQRRWDNAGKRLGSFSNSRWPKQSSKSQCEKAFTPEIVEVMTLTVWQKKRVSSLVHNLPILWQKFASRRENAWNTSIYVSLEIPVQQCDIYSSWNGFPCGVMARALVDSARFGNKNRIYMSFRLVCWPHQWLFTSLALKKARSSVGTDRGSGLMKPLSMLTPPTHTHNGCHLPHGCHPHWCAAKYLWPEGQISSSLFPQSTACLLHDRTSCLSSWRLSQCASKKEINFFRQSGTIPLDSISCDAVLTRQMRSGVCQKHLSAITQIPQWKTTAWKSFLLCVFLTQSFW